MLTAIDHIVLTVKNMDKTISFYCKILGMELCTFVPPGELERRHSLKFGQQKINLHYATTPYEPHAKNPVAGSVDICFLSDISIIQWQKTFAKHNITILAGPIQKTGATGNLVSIYIRDPDLNLIEIANRLLP